MNHHCPDCGEQFSPALRCKFRECAFSTSKATVRREAAPEDAVLVKLAERLEARGDNAYVAYIDQLRRDECLGREIKVERGEFGETEFRAHMNAAEQLGRHRALHEAAKELREAASRIEALSRGKKEVGRG